MAIQWNSILLTGGAGFVGSNLAIRLRQRSSQTHVFAIDNLKRRGSELALSRLADAGVRFIHADVRCWEDLQSLPDFDVLIDCAAEPSVHAGVDSSPSYVLNTNLGGTIQCLELSRLRGAAFLFLSTSRVFPIAALNDIPYTDIGERFAWCEGQTLPGFSEHGIAESFPMAGARSYYGASKLASEHILEEYVFSAGMKAIINRCGIVAGPWQMGKTDQGVVTFWVARHHFGLPLAYIGFGGEGKQVRDILHIDDLSDLIELQMERPELWDGRIYNVGGGADVAVSLRELTQVCESVTEQHLNIGSAPETSPVDIRIYYTDTRKVTEEFGWVPKRNVQTIVADIHTWIRQNECLLESVLN